MRLIDADKWTGELKNSFTTPNYHPDLGDPFQCMKTEKHNEDVADLIMMIDTQSTAYDVDKVVEKLEKEARMLYSLGAFEPVSAWETKDILPIVKGGGIDERDRKSNRRF